MRNLELSCLCVLPAHSPELSSHVQLDVEFSRTFAALECRVDAGILSWGTLGVSRSKPVKLQQSQRDVCSSCNECDQDKAAIVQFKNEASRLEFLLDFSSPPPPPF